MELIALKMPPDRVVLMADAIERDLTAHPTDTEAEQLTEVLVWLRYRHSKWTTRKTRTRRR